jgi:hypothetical protein
MAIVTTAVTGATLLVCSALLTVYKFYKLERIRKEYEYIRRSRAVITSDT